MTPLATEDRRAAAPAAADLGALIPGLLFVVLAIIAVAGVDLPEELFGRRLVWIVLIGAGVGLLVSELRRARRRRR